VQVLLLDAALGQAVRHFRDFDAVRAALDAAALVHGRFSEIRTLGGLFDRRIEGHFALFLDIKGIDSLIGALSVVRSSFLQGNFARDAFQLPQDLGSRPVNLINMVEMRRG
jgi:hypothetical protein